MTMGRPKAELILTAEQEEQLKGMSASRSLPAGLVMRARIILMSAGGESNLAIATRLRLSQATVGQWRRRFVAQGISGLHD
jgi:putative transposase